LDFDVVSVFWGIQSWRGESKEELEKTKKEINRLKHYVHFSGRKT